MRDRVREEAEAILAPYFAALTGAVVFDKLGGAHVPTLYPDLGARIDAAEKLLDRVEGKPKQTTEVSGPDGGPVQTEVSDALLADDEARAAALELRRRVAVAREELAGGSRARD